MLDFAQQPDGGQIVAVGRTGINRIVIIHGQDSGRLELSPLDAAQLLAGLSMVLDLPLTKTSMKAIKI